MTYEKALEKIHSLDKFGSRPGLDRVSKLFSLVDEKLLEQNFIHVAGTNGKGSVCQMINSILLAQGYTTGMFISPYIIDFTERIQINGQSITHEELSSATEYLWDFVEQLNKENIIITEFEFITVLAFYLFRKHDVNYIVCEVGMGGLLDSTNLIKNPLCTVITRIDLDHTNILGPTIQEIAYQKCGIIKDNGMVVTSYQQKEVMDIIKDTARKKKNLIFYASDVKIDDIQYSINRTSFIYKEIPMSIKLLGKHQIENLKTTLSVIDAIKLKNIKVDIQSDKLGLENVSNPGRFEVIQKDPLIIIDGGHNPSGINSFVESIKLYDNENKKVLILGMLKDKDIKSSLKYLNGVFDTIITVNVDNPRSESNIILKDLCNDICDNVIVSNSLDNAITIARQSKKDIFIAGSLYLASSARKLLLK